MLRLLRIIGIIALFLAVLELQTEAPVSGGQVLILRDVSKSISPELSQIFKTEIENVRRYHTPRVIDFADGVSRTGGLEAYGRTNIEEAIRSAGEKIVILLSDGYQNKGDALNSAESAGTKIYLPREVLNFNDLGNTLPKITYLTAPPNIKQDQKFSIATGVVNSKNSDELLNLRLYVNNKEINKEDFKLASGEAKGFIKSSQLGELKDAEIRAELWSDKLIDQRVIYISAQESDDIRLYSARAEDSRFIGQVIRDAGYKLQEKLGEPLPTEVTSGSLVILNNLTAAEAGPGAAKLEEYARRGGRVLIIGGPSAFGMGRYQDTPLDRLSPLKSLPPEREKKRVNVGVALVIDKSRSMASNYKIDFAKDAAREVVKNLKDEDLLTVIGFDAAPFVAVSLGYLKNIRASALQRVGMLFPAGRTNLLPSIDEARRALQRAEAGRKHVIILTDGKVPDEGPFYLTLIREMRLAGITVSTVLLGSDAEPGMLKQLAELGGGSFYQTNDPSSLPRIFMKDIYVQGGDRTLQESSNYPVRLGVRGAPSTTLTGFPTLRGFVRTEVKSGAEEELQVADAPLLASWRFGEGRVVAFSSDVSGRWSSEWISWPRFREFWGDIISSFGIVGDTGDTTLDLRTSFEGDTVKLSLVSYGLASGEVVATLEGPDGDRQAISFTQAAPGRFEGIAKLSKEGKYKLVPKLNGKVRTPLSFDVAQDVLSDFSGGGVNRPFLESLAALSGGEVYNTADTVPVPSGIEVKGFNGLFIAIGLIALLLEIVLRETRRRGQRSVRAVR